MFVPFLIMLREGLEAALIVSLIASYLKRTQRGRWIGVMWVGVFLAAALCLGLGILINETTGEFPQKEQELFEGIVAVIAVVILTWMVFWSLFTSCWQRFSRMWGSGRRWGPCWASPRPWCSASCCTGAVSA